jgi:hypothetical protein
MNFDQYSRSEFEKLGHGTDEALSLADRMGKEVQSELFELIRPRMIEIATELMKRGHDLTEDARNYPDCICFREVGEEKHRVPGLILAVDLVITNGFPFTLTHQERLEMEKEYKVGDA